MKQIFLLTLLSFLGAAVHVSAVCDTCFMNKCYVRTNLLIGSFSIIGQLAVDRTSNIVYVHFSDHRNNVYNVGINLDKLEFEEIPNFEVDTFARAVDENTHDVYMSSDIGVYKYNPTTGQIHYYDVSNSSIWHLQYKDKLYYSDYNRKGLFIFENEESKPIPALSNFEIDNFIVDKNNDIYFRHNFAIYRYKNGAQNATLFKDEIFTLATDNNGEAYLVHTETYSLYKVDYSQDTLELKSVGSFGFGRPYSVVFDSTNNIIYHDTQRDHIYLLTPNGNLCRIMPPRVGSTRDTLSFSYNTL